MSFAISSLNSKQFNQLFHLSDVKLQELGGCRTIADADFGYPDRVTLTDVPAGTELILLHHEHQPVPTPYRASGPIFVSQTEGAPVRVVDEVPASLARRVLSLRAYDQHGMMVTAIVLDGQDLAPRIEALFDDPDIAYLHAHYASRGCYAARIDRA